MPSRTSYGSNYFGTDEQIGYGQQPGAGRRNGGMAIPRGGPGQGHAQFGFGGLSGGQNTTYLNRPSDNIGSANWGAISGIQNYMGGLAPAQQQQANNFLRSAGAMPSWNGSYLDDINAGRGPVQQWTGGNQQSPASDHAARTGGMGSPAYALGPEFGRGGEAFNRTLGAGGAGGMGGPDGPGGGFGGAGGGAGGLEGEIEKQYTNLIQRGGLMPEDDRRVERDVDTSNRATRDAIQSARLDAVRRGSDGGDLGDVEARIRGQGASRAISTRDESRRGLRNEAMNRLLAALGGASGFANNRAQLELLAGQLAQEGGMGNLSFLLGS